MNDDYAITHTAASPSGMDAFVRVNHAGEILEADRYAAELFGKPPEHLINHPLWHFCPQTICKNLQETIERMQQAPAHANIESFDGRHGALFRYHIFPTQNELGILISNLNAYDARIAPQAHVPAKTAANEQNDVLDSLFAAKEQLEMALDAAHIATSNYDARSRTFAFSDCIENVLGVPAESLPRTPEDLREWMFPGEYEAYIARVEAAVNAGEEYIEEMRIRIPKTGEVRWMEHRGRTLKDPNGIPIRIYGIVQDITQRKLYEEELERRVEERTAELRTANSILRESEERLGMALKNAPITLSIVDKDLRYTWFHHPLLPEAEQYVGKTADAFLSPADAAQLNSMKRQVLNTGIGMRREFAHELAGHYVWFDMLMEPLKHENGEIKGVITVALDITEQRRAEKELRDLNSALGQRARQLRDLSIELTRTEEKERRRLAGVLHDNLQQLMVGARLYLQSTLAYPMEDEMRTNLEKAQAILDEAVSASRSLTAELAPSVLYRGGLQQALQWLAEWVKEKHGLEVTVESDTRTEEVDQELRTAIFQAVRELLFNVVKHARVKHAAVILCYGGNDIIAVRVQDRGVGFDPEQLGKNESGGFGLMAVRERLAAIGGIMEVDSAPGKGTTTTIKVPANISKGNG